MDDYSKQVAKRVFTGLSFAAGLLAITSAGISVIASALEQEFMKFFSVVFGLFWVRIVAFAVMEFAVKYVAGFLMATLATSKGEFRFAKVNSVGLVGLVSAGLSSFNVQWLVLGRPRKRLGYKLGFSAIFVFLFFVSVGMAHDHYKKLVQTQRKPRGKAAEQPKGGRRKKGWSFGQVLEPIRKPGPMQIVSVYQAAGFVLMAFIALRRVL